LSNQSNNNFRILTLKLIITSLKDVYLIIIIIGLNIVNKDNLIRIMKF